MGSAPPRCSGAPWLAARRLRRSSQKQQQQRASRLSRRGRGLAAAAAPETKNSVRCSFLLHSLAALSQSSSVGPLAAAGPLGPRRVHGARQHGAAGTRRASGRFAAARQPRLPLAPGTTPRTARPWWNGAGGRRPHARRLRQRGGPADRHRPPAVSGCAGPRSPPAQRVLRRAGAKAPAPRPLLPMSVCFTSQTKKPRGPPARPAASGARPMTPRGSAPTSGRAHILARSPGAPDPHPDWQRPRTSCKARATRPLSGYGA